MRAEAGLLVPAAIAVGVVMVAFAVADHISRAATVHIRTNHGYLESRRRRLLR